MYIRFVLVLALIMINEIFKSTSHVINERIKNPIVGSLIIAWFYVNWRLVYMVFNFPEEMTFDNKLEKINTHLLQHKFELLFKPIILAFGILLSYHILSNIALVIISFFQKRVKPKIIEFFDKSLVIERHIYNDLKQSHSKSLDELENLQQSYYRLKTERDKYKDDIEKLELDKSKNDSDKLLIEARLERDKLLEEVQEIKEKMIEQARVEALKEAEETINEEKHKEEGNNKKSIFNQPINNETLKSYSNENFPDKKNSEFWQNKLIQDLNKSKYKTIADIDSAVKKASSFIKYYEVKNPAVFNYSTDILTKSLGYVDIGFRKAHNWSEETLYEMENFNNNKS